MAKKILNVIDVAYRATLEEQDDPVIWLSHVLKGNGAELHLLLRGAAVNYGVKSQDASGLSFGEKRQTQPPRIVDDLTSIVNKGVVVHYVQEDVRERGITESELVSTLTPVSRADLPALFGHYDQIWKW